MTIQERIAALVAAAAEHLGSQSALARKLEVSRQAVNEWIKCKATPSAAHVIAMQDLLRRTACVALAATGLAISPQDANAIAAFDNGTSSVQTDAQYTLCPNWIRSAVKKVRQLLQYVCQVYTGRHQRFGFSG